LSQLKHSTFPLQKTPGECGSTFGGYVGPIVFPFLGAELGGSHISAFTLVRSLTSDFGVRCIVLAATGTRIAEEAARFALEVEPTAEGPAMRHRNNPIYDFAKFAPRLRLLKKFGRSAIVHCNDVGALQAWGPVAKLLGLRLVYHHRTFNFLLNRLLVHMADDVICISDACRQTVGFLPERRKSTVHNPFSMAIDIDRRVARSRLFKSLGLASDSVLIGFIGNFWSRKRADFFLDVCAAVSERNQRAHFVLFGRSGNITEAQLLKRAEEYGIRDRTIFAGFRFPMDDNIASMDLLIAPALDEPFGRTLVEALLLGTPYVATAGAGHNEIASRWAGGRLIDCHATAGEFAEAANCALADSAEIVLNREDRLRIAQELSPRSHAEKVLATYRKLRGFC
jgi:glycosyltransferase involved in cell wall biosynthesis